MYVVVVVVAPGDVRCNPNGSTGSYILLPLTGLSVSPNTLPLMLSKGSLGGTPTMCSTASCIRTVSDDPEVTSCWSHKCTGTRSTVVSDRSYRTVCLRAQALIQIDRTCKVCRNCMAAGCSVFYGLCGNAHSVGIRNPRLVASAAPQRLGPPVWLECCWLQCTWHACVLP